MTDAKGASAPNLHRNYDDPAEVTHEEWLWLSEWLLDRARINCAGDDYNAAKYRMAAAACRVMHEQTRESGDG